MMSSYGLRGVTFWLFLLSCACQSSKVSSEVSQAAGDLSEPAIAEVVTKRCEDRSFCTREYRPSSCVYDGHEISAPNPCEAGRQARRLACDLGQPFLEGKLRCEVNQNRPQKQLDCTQRPICTREYIPHQCVFGGKLFKSSNLCEAMVQVKLFACKNSLKVTDEQVTCTKIQDLEASP